MRINWKTITAGVLLLLLVVMVIPKSGDKQAPDHDTQRKGAAELKVKQQLLEQDIKMTEKLCRNHCRLDFERVLHSAADHKQPISLADLKRSRPHMQYLESMQGGQMVTEGDRQQLPEEVAPYLDLARDSAKSGRAYESPRITTDDGPYFVLALPKDDGQSYMLGAVKQEVLEHVRIEQRKNLRLVPYPSDERFGIQAADSDTLRKVDVDQPEENENVSHYYMNEIVVRFASDPSDGQLAQIVEAIDADHIDKLGYAFVFRSRSMDAEQLMNYFNNEHEILYAEPHYIYVTNEEQAIKPNDVLYEDYQWNLPAIRTEIGWNISGGDEVTIAVIDTGVDPAHVDLQSNMTTGYNVYTDSNHAADDVGHGTHVAGIIAAHMNNYEGIAGVAPNSKIMPVKVLDSSGAGSTYAVAEGIIWAVDHGAKVINLSLGNYAQAEFLHDAIRYAYDNDVVLIAATGNDNTETPGYPAAYEEVLAVGATDYYGQIAPFSNYGSYVDVTAPGVSIASTYPGSQYTAMSGTSMASPHVAALAGMIRSVNPMLSNEEVMGLIRSTATDLGNAGHDIYFGHGQINIEQALIAARSSGQTLVNWGEQLQRGIDHLIKTHE